MSQVNFIIRPYNAADSADLAQLYFDSARSLGLRRYTPEQVKAWAPAPASADVVHEQASDGRLTLVACGVDGAVVAYGDLEPNGHIDHLYAHPDASGRGVAGAVLNALIAAAEVSEIAELHVEASELARGLFERAGFSVTRRRDFEVNGEPIHNYAMSRRLRPAATVADGWAMTLRIRPNRPEEVDRLVEIWGRAVDATHHFLATDDRLAIEEEVRAFFPAATFVVACNTRDEPVGFMLMDGPHLEALFVDPDHHGKGVGKALLQSAISEHEVITTDVNEANSQALGFYEQMGFKAVGRSDLDAQARPYPLLHLRR